MHDKWIWSKGREGGTHKESGVRKNKAKRGIVKISCLEWMELREENMERNRGRNVLTGKFGHALFYFAFLFLEMRVEISSRRLQESLKGDFFYL